MATRTAFDFDHLQRVVPVALTRQLPGQTLTVTSLELYRDGFIVLLLHEWTANIAAVGTFEPLTHVVEAADERGQRYAGRPRAGYGSGDQRGAILDRLMYGFTPALDPAAGQLILTLTAVTRMRGGAMSGPVFDPADVRGGPWTATFELPPRP